MTSGQWVTEVSHDLSYNHWFLPLCLIMLNDQNRLKSSNKGNIQTEMFCIVAGFRTKRILEAHVYQNQFLKLTVYRSQRA